MFEAFGPDVVGSRKCLVAVSLIEHFADGIGMAKKKAMAAMTAVELLCPCTHVAGRARPRTARRLALPQTSMEFT